MTEQDELHERVILLMHEFDSGRFHAPADTMLRESLARIQFDREGRVEPESVDSMVRAASLAVVAAVRDRQLLDTSLIDVQGAYFEGLDQCFGWIQKEMNDRGLTPHQVAVSLASNDEAMKTWAKEGRGYIDAFREFWDANKEIVRAHLWRQEGLKAAFGGDVFPSHADNIACSVGLYVDTIILPDPVLRVLPLFNLTPPDRQLYYVVKHALSAMDYRDIALAETERPIVVFTSDLSAVPPSEMPSLIAIADQDTLQHCSKMFGREFEDKNKLVNFLKSFSSVEKMTQALADPDRLLVNVESSGTLIEQLEEYRSSAHRENVADVLDHMGDGLVYPLTQGRMVQANDALHKARYFQAHPIIQAPTSWQYMLWKYEYDTARGLGEDLKDVVITRTLAAEQEADNSLIRDVPPDVLVELRMKGALDELRQLISEGTDEIQKADEQSVRDVTNTVLENISNAVADHQKELKSLASSKRKFYGFDVGGWIATGGISVAAAASGNVGWGLTAALVGLAGLPSGRELWAKRKELASEGRELARSPVALCFQPKQR